jgi:hypothetical protein
VEAAINRELQGIGGFSFTGDMRNHPYFMRRSMRELADGWRSMKHANAAIAEGKALAHLQHALVTISPGTATLEVSPEREESDPVLHLILHTGNAGTEEVRGEIQRMVSRVSVRHNVRLDVRLHDCDNTGLLGILP